MIYLHHDNLQMKYYKKLTELYGGDIFLEQKKQPYINLSNANIDHEIKEVFALGTNCLIKTKIDDNKKKMEIEKLFYDISNLSKQNKIMINNEERLTCELKRYGLKSSKDVLKTL